MKALLDTHSFLWWTTDDPRLSRAARRVIREGRNQILVSAATAWEIAIKAQRGRLTLPRPPAEYIASRMAEHRFGALPIQIVHALAVYGLPEHHADPFDRMLVAQARVEKIPIITDDPFIRSYDVQVIW